MTTAGLALLLVPVGLFVYAYALYPLLLVLAAGIARPRDRRPRPDPDPWPTVSVSLPAYNEEATIAGALDALLAVGYPRDRLQIVVVSDASADRTDEIVRGYADRGVELVRRELRGGKTAAENAAAAHLTGEIVVNTDASIRVLPGSLEPLVRALGDPTVGVASGRDISVGFERQENPGEAGYVGYEMWVRSLETRLGSIVGASGCFYATRADLHRIPVPDSLSRDFAAVLKARLRGYRSVHVPDALCLVPRTGSVDAETRRKGRTMARGLKTLLHYRTLMNPLRYGRFAWKLLSHKLCRWLVPPTAPLALAGVALLAPRFPLAGVALAGALAAGLCGVVALRWPGHGRPPRVVALCGYAVGAVWAGIVAWYRIARGERPSIWEPTRRAAPDAAQERRPAQ